MFRIIAFCFIITTCGIFLSCDLFYMNDESYIDDKYLLCANQHKTCSKMKTSDNEEYCEAEIKTETKYECPCKKYAREKNIVTKASVDEEKFRTFLTVMKKVAQVNAIRDAVRILQNLRKQLGDSSKNRNPFQMR